MVGANKGPDGTVDTDRAMVMTRDKSFKFVAGAKKSPDGSLDVSKAVVFDRPKSSGPNTTQAARAENVLTAPTTTVAENAPDPSKPIEAEIRLDDEALMQRVDELKSKYLKEYEKFKKNVQDKMYALGITLGEISSLQNRFSGEFGNAKFYIFPDQAFNALAESGYTDQQILQRREEKQVMSPVPQEVIDKGKKTIAPTLVEFIKTYRKKEILDFCAVAVQHPNFGSENKARIIKAILEFQRNLASDAIKSSNGDMLVDMVIQRDTLVGKMNGNDLKDYEDIISDILLDLEL